MSCFFCSSDVGRPIDFCLWSYIIFSTIPRVSPSRSDSCPAGKKNTVRRGREAKPKAEFTLRLWRHLWVLWTDFLGVNFWISGDNLTPPLHLIYLKSTDVIRSGGSHGYRCRDPTVRLSMGALLFPGAPWRPCRRRWATSFPPPSPRCKAGLRWPEGVPSGRPWASVAGCPRPHLAP